MSKFETVYVTPNEEPIMPSAKDRFTDDVVPSEDEVAYLGNSWNYCNFFHAMLKNCVEGEILGNNPYVYKACSKHLSDLNKCYSLDPQTEETTLDFMEDNKECLYERDVFLKCYFVQANNWLKCHPAWVNLKRCYYRKKAASSSE